MKTHLTVLILCLGIVPVIAAGGTLTGGATLPEQIVQEVTAIQAQTSGAERLVEQIQQYENMVQNMVTLPQSMIGQITQPIDQLYGMAAQAQQLGTNAMNISNQFQNLNASFNPQLTAEYTQKYESITTGLNNALNTAIQAANLNPNAFATQAQAEQAISQALANPQSRNALLQGAVSAGQATVSALTQMQQTANTEAAAEMEWRKNQLAYQTNQAAANDAAEKALYGDPNNPQPGVVVGGGTWNALSNALGGN
ncbi:MAG: TrbJ/VirB5 family protein [Acidithiobacillus sp.]|jgi:P-type conjugative transfer protein TrbJ|uniref:conjugal transfer protein TrbJ n=1 Tax=Acidithiobacillus TaxID=119977 RepID=UPI001C07E8CB|nr:MULTISPECIES: conjugal transfer protein TrbJ [Acidithiobacillus]MBU2774498.1 conjugal transfer protein TrbJ [Acidithiobacillus ferrooxidans]MBW9250220.1 conjugal transfer protein TrbJ [Acidithiobacillus ferriphilus]MCR1345499.1 conjugal transfer protein TrbJ [Acidithiobacillus ferrooxidans]MCR1355805.1 conjugal transfer protein TrbJ [Acidithiobacillus ferrooxidans]MEB8475555.1 conjugal transfer protein TrbJ [Acidithiobacillus ferriphilus]